MNKGTWYMVDRLDPAQQADSVQCAVVEVSEHKQAGNHVAG